MPKRSISDSEIALIKAMLARNMKNKDIQFYFNRPERPVNSGRISTIGTGTYSNSSSIPSAADAELDTFIAKFNRDFLPVDSACIDSESGESPQSEDLALFLAEEDGVYRLLNGETDEIECKTSFGFKHSDKWLRAVAALSNNRGGRILFGVSDKGGLGEFGERTSHEVTGLDDDLFIQADPVEFTKKIKSMFDPTPRVQTRILRLGSKIVGIMEVEKHPSRPVIATRGEGEIREGDIFFRYPGQSARIKHSDLRSMLDERDAQSRSQIIPMIERLIEIGPSRAMIADLSLGELSDGDNVIQIDESLQNSINFIKEGEFRETTGAPTLRLVGEVSVSNTAEAPVSRHIITKDDVVLDFLNDKLSAAPEEYIRFSIEQASCDWLPIHYYAGKMKGSIEDAIAFIEDTKGTPIRKRNAIERLKGSHTAYQQPTGSAAAKLKSILAERPMEISDNKSASTVGLALQGLQSKEKLESGAAISHLKSAYEHSSGVARSQVRRAVCRIDEVYFGKFS